MEAFGNDTLSEIWEQSRLDSRFRGNNSGASEDFCKGSLKEHIIVSFLPASVPASLSSPKSPWLSRSGFSPCPIPYLPTRSCLARHLRRLASGAAHCARRFASAVRVSVHALGPIVGSAFRAST